MWGAKVQTSSCICRFSYTVSHFSYAPLFQRPHFDKNAGIEHSLWQFTYWHFICLMTSKKILESLMWIIMLRQRQFWQKCTCNLNVYIFYLCFTLCIIHDDRCDGKTPKTIILITTSKTPFLVVEFSNTFTFWRNARFDAIITAGTIINQVFLRRSFC